MRSDVIANHRGHEFRLCEALMSRDPVKRVCDFKGQFKVDRYAEADVFVKDCLGEVIFHECLLNGLTSGRATRSKGQCRRPAIQLL